MAESVRDYKPPETINEGLQSSIEEENIAADWYRRRGMHAQLRDDEVTADLYEHIAREEDRHHQEFKNRAEVVMSGKELEHWRQFGVMDLNIIIGTISGEGAIPARGRETRKAPCRGCRIDSNKPLESGNCMVTTEGAIGMLNPQEVRDWCSEIIELQDGRCERARSIKEAAGECKAKYPSDMKGFLQCYIPTFSELAK
jgi:hypothetical protein